MSNPKDGNIQFHQVERFANTFVDILWEEVSSNSQQLELAQSTYRQNLRKTFEKSIEETSSILDLARKSGRKTKSYFKGRDKSQTSRGLDEDIRSPFVTDNKSSVLIDRSIRTFTPNTTSTPSKSPISSRTRSKVDARDVRTPLRLFIPTVLLIIQILRKKKRKKMSNLEKRLGNLLKKLRVDENSVLFAKGDELNKKTVSKLAKSRYDKDTVLLNLYREFKNQMVEKSKN